MNLRDRLITVQMLAIVVALLADLMGSELLVSLAVVTFFAGLAAMLLQMTVALLNGLRGPRIPDFTAKHPR